MAGVWAGAGVVTLEDGSTERIRCRATDAVGAGGNGLNLTLLCASDSYKFDLTGNVISEGGELSGTWGESSRGLRGNLQGRGANGNFQVIASAPRIHGQSFSEHARQPAIHCHQIRERLPGCVDFAVAPLAVLADGSIASVWPISRRFP